MQIRAFERKDAADVAALSAACARSESDFVLNPLWETEDELFAEFERHGIEPESHLLVADADAEGIVGLVGFVCAPGAKQAGLFCPIVRRGERGNGVGGKLLRGALALGREELGIDSVTAAVGTRNRSGYSLLTAYGFRPQRQVFVMRCEARPHVDSLPIEGLQLEPAKPGDAPQLLEIYSTCDFPPRVLADFESRLDGGRHRHMVARDSEGRVAAFVELETHWPARPWVAFVAVLPELRDRGLGSSMVGLALARCFDDGASSALLALSPANRGAVRAYEKVGFRRYRLLDVLEQEL